MLILLIPTQLTLILLLFTNANITNVNTTNANSTHAKTNIANFNNCTTANGICTTDNLANAITQ